MKKEPTFEENMAKLEALVSELESGEKTLDESIRLFEEGARLAARLDKKLAKAEQKIETLTSGAAGADEEEPSADAPEQSN